MCKYIVILLSMLHKLPRAHSEPFGIIPHFNSANSCSIFEQNPFFNFIHASFIGFFLLKKILKLSKMTLLQRTMKMSLTCTQFGGNIQKSSV